MVENRFEKRAARRIAELLNLNYTSGLRLLRQNSKIDFSSMTDEEIRTYFAK